MEFGSEVSNKFVWLRLVITVVLAWTLLYTDQHLGNVSAQVRGQISTWVIIPAQFLAQLPKAAWSTTSDYFKSRDELILAKRDLEEQLLRERNRYNSLLHIENENDQLRNLLEARKRFVPDAITAEVINTASLPFIKRIVINKGSDDGIKLRRGLFNEQGIVGQLTRVDAATSQALLLTDKRFWVATRVERNGLLVLLQGDGIDRLRVRFVPADAGLEKGDTLVTAGGSGPFPAGLPVAVVGTIWHPQGIPFLDGEALPLASIRQSSALLVHNDEDSLDPDVQMPVEPSGAVPAQFVPGVLP